MKTTKKLLFSVAALVITLIVATSTTFAWFTMNTNLDITGVDMTVTSGTPDLYFSLTNTDGSFTSQIDGADVKAYLLAQAKLNGLPETSTLSYGAATTLDGVAFTAKDGTTAMVANTYDVNTKTVSYASFTIYFRANQALDIKLDATADKSTITAQGTFNTKNPVFAWDDFAANKYTDAAITKGAAIAARAANVARVSFASNKNVWNPNAATGTYKFGNIANDYANHLANGATPSTAPADPESGMYTGATMVDGTTVLKTLTAASGADIGKAAFTGSLTINIWNEGWDAECLNNIYEDVYTVVIALVGTTPVAQP